MKPPKPAKAETTGIRFPWQRKSNGASPPLPSPPQPTSPAETVSIVTGRDHSLCLHPACMNSSLSVGIPSSVLCKAHHVGHSRTCTEL